MVTNNQSMPLVFALLLFLNSSMHQIYWNQQESNPFLGVIRHAFFVKLPLAFFVYLWGILSSRRDPKSAKIMHTCAGVVPSNIVISINHHFLAISKIAFASLVAGFVHIFHQEWIMKLLYFGVAKKIFLPGHRFYSV